MTVAVAPRHGRRPVDISERKDAYLVAVELPGVGIDDLEITFQDGLLTIQGERHFAHDSSEEKVHRVERRYGAFRRSITLPSHVMADAIEASAQDGVLQILVPKAEEVQAKRIQVRVGQGHADADTRRTRTRPAADNPPAGGTDASRRHRWIRRWRRECARLRPPAQPRKRAAPSASW